MQLWQLWQVRDAGVAWEDLDGLSGVMRTEFLRLHPNGRFLVEGDTLRFREDGDGFVWEAADRGFWSTSARTYCVFTVSVDLLDLLGA